VLTRRRSGLVAMVAGVALLAACSSEPEPTPSPTAAPSGTASIPVPGTSGSLPPSGAPPSGAPSSSSAPGKPPVAGARWIPKPGTTWQWQLNGSVDLSVDAQVYDVDGFTTSADTVRELHNRGRKVICYVEVGSAEDFRPDHGAWPKEVLGKDNGWKGEKWIDIRNPEKLKPVIAARFDMCRDKGFDGIEPDLMDGYANDTGFPITAAHQLAFNRWVADIAHARGMSVGLKNDVEQVPQLVGSFEFAVNEECAEFDECDGLKPFIDAGKAVFHAEYKAAPASFCAESKALKLSSVKKNLNLDAARTTC
jgi:hypothetical protein